MLSSFFLSYLNFHLDFLHFLRFSQIFFLQSIFVWNDHFCEVSNGCSIYVVSNDDISWARNLSRRPKEHRFQSGRSGQPGGWKMSQSPVRRRSWKNTIRIHHNRIGGRAWNSTETSHIECPVIQYILQLLLALPLLLIQKCSFSIWIWIHIQFYCVTPNHTLSSNGTNRTLKREQKIGVGRHRSGFNWIRCNCCWWRQIRFTA